MNTALWIRNFPKQECNDCLKILELLQNNNITMTIEAVFVIWKVYSESNNQKWVSLDSLDDNEAIRIILRNTMPQQFPQPKGCPPLEQIDKDNERFRQGYTEACEKFNITTPNQKAH